MTKHEQILEHIENLAIGMKISVRQIAKDLQVSEGTAYRAIKDAEIKGIVSTIERVGTVRIEKKSRDKIDNLTFAEIVNIIDGNVLAGKKGLYKSLSKFAIGAMEIKDVAKYIGENTLIIVGNRTNVHKLALSQGTAILVTGGFDIDPEVKQLANTKDLPIIQSNFDTFTVANMINRAIYDQVIKKEVLTVQDILIPISKTSYLKENDTISDWNYLSEVSRHTRFPVLDDNEKLSGIVTSKDIVNQAPQEKIKRIMTKAPKTVSITTTIAGCAHMMIWEGIELLPVTTKQNNLIGIVSREDVLRAMQTADRQPQNGETINDQVVKQMTFGDVITVKISPQMSNQLGTLSKSSFVAIIEMSVKHFMKKNKKVDIITDSMNVHFLKTVQIDEQLEVNVELLDMGRKFAKLEVSITESDQLVSKSMLVTQIIDHLY